MAEENGRARGRQGGRGAGRGDERRRNLAEEAAAHVAEMHDRFGAEIARAVKDAKFYDSVPKAGAASKPAVKSSVARDSGVQDAAVQEAEVPAAEAPEAAAPEAAAPAAEAPEAAAPQADLPTVTVVDQDSVAAVIERGRGIASACDLAVLDFASFTYPGGAYLRGSMAQEEALCAESFLYNALDQFKGWYAENRRRNINCELYRDRAFVVPKVRFERERYHSYADVIVAAAPNARRARADYHVDDAALERAMRGRIRLVLGIADELGHDKLVLGAFGCGVFGWHAGQVAELFREELAGGSHVAKTVVFAVPKGSHDENLERFQHAFAKFPERNDAPYAPRAAEPVRVAAPKSDDADEGEEDWRKYL